MGRSAAKGIVLYRDIADHKGFYLFFINMISAWLSPDNMNALFIIEVLFAWVKLVFVYRTAVIFEKDTKKCMLTAMLFMAVATNFYHGTQEIWEKPMPLPFN